MDGRKGRGGGAWRKGHKRSSHSGMLLFAKIVAGLAALYIIVVALIALAQDWLLFPRWALGNGALLPENAEQLVLEVPSGETLIGVRLPERESPSVRIAASCFGLVGMNPRGRGFPTGLGRSAAHSAAETAAPEQPDLHLDSGCRYPARPPLLRRAGVGARSRRVRPSPLLPKVGRGVTIPVGWDRFPT